ncbi:TPA: hypothetical protein JI109_15765, partial [Acinetobacter baumannii]|nr:hypothetical protein [Acinetobacter baumannii]
MYKGLIIQPFILAKIMYIDNLKDFLDLVSLNENDLKRAQIKVKELVEIYNAYEIMIPQLQHEAAFLAGSLSFCSEINSYRWRVKNPFGLLKKIIRKRIDALEKQNIDSDYLKINAKNFHTIVTDLIGIRGIFVFKEQWKAIDSYIQRRFKLDNSNKICIYYVENEDDLSYFPEIPKSDEDKLTSLYAFESKPNVKYRSTHYIARSINQNGMKFEIQIRTILEEAWGEIDHSTRYPYLEKDPTLIRESNILNGAIISAEKTTTSMLSLSREINKKNLENLSQKTLKENKTSNKTKVIKTTKNSYSWNDFLLDQANIQRQQKVSTEVAKILEKMRSLEDVSRITRALNKSRHMSFHDYLTNKTN